MIYSTISSLAPFDLGCTGCTRRGWIQYFISVSEPLSDTPVIIWWQSPVEEYAFNWRSFNMSMPSERFHKIINTNHGLHDIARYLTWLSNPMYDRKHEGYLQSCWSNSTREWSFRLVIRAQPVDVPESTAAPLWTNVTGRMTLSEIAWGVVFWKGVSMKWLESNEYQSMPSYRLVTARIFWFGETAEQPLNKIMMWDHANEPRIAGLYILQDRGRMRHLISRVFTSHALLVRQQMSLVEYN